ncbi:unnamed protein product [Eruca vesicaria subsp. sativa]|uniref:Yippee domain-containing protein n=1 Tax=Eruca vesicaria subsp. sativa TaxID=29727 RepID=A0ABC8LIH9_ERUVS|nr:unnamed protein product [Eruca vesicaria subsp. sativa]
MKRSVLFGWTYVTLRASPYHIISCFVSAPKTSPRSSRPLSVLSSHPLPIPLPLNSLPPLFREVFLDRDSSTTTLHQYFVKLIQSNATSCSHFCFDCATSVGKEQFERLVGDGANASSSSSKVVPAQNLEPAEVTGVQSEKEWSYIGCSKCAKKLQREVSCGVDCMDDAVFVAFDTEIAKLTNIQAAEAVQILVDDHGPDDNGDRVGLTGIANKQRVVNGENVKKKARQE